MGDAHLEPQEIIERSEPPSPGKIRGEISLFEQREKEAEDMEADEGTDIETGIDMEMHGKDIILVVSMGSGKLFARECAINFN